MEIREGFWQLWGKFVGILLGILALWILLIFICDKFFGKSFEELKYIHYFIFLVVILKAKKWFLKKLEDSSEKNEQSNEKIELKDVESKNKN